MPSSRTFFSMGKSPLFHIPSVMIVRLIVTP
jgi:hypothetical protein